MNASTNLSPEARSTRQMTDLRTELQSAGLRLVDPNAGAASRRGGAGPSDHKAVTVDGVTIMVPVHTSSAWHSPFVASAPDAAGESALMRGTIPIANISFPKAPRFTRLQTLDGVPYSHIATLHGTDVLATTVLQTCIRYESRKKTCKFCAIGQSLAAGRTIARKTPEQLAEVTRAAVLLDGVKHMVLTTGTPPTPDRGAQILCESAFAIRAAVDLPIQAQCEPPDDDAWFTRMREAGIDTLGMHLEVIGEAERARIMPGKATVPVSRYMEAFEAAVRVFGRGQVSTYLLAGLGDTPQLVRFVRFPRQRRPLHAELDRRVVEIERITFDSFDEHGHTSYEDNDEHAPHLPQPALMSAERMSACDSIAPMGASTERMNSGAGAG